MFSKKYTNTSTAVKRTTRFILLLLIGVLINNFVAAAPFAMVEAGAISLVDGTTSTSICVDGVGDPLEIVLDGNSMGSNQEFVITDDIGTILALPGTGVTGPFDLDGAGEGTCQIWYLAYEDGLEGLALNNNLSDLSGNFDLSNEITVVRQAANGGMVSLSDGATTYTGTAGDIVIEVQHTTTATALSYWYIITDADDNILAYANSADTNTLDLSGAPPGECHVWGWSYRNEVDPIVGEPITSLSDGDCEAISDNFITVIRQSPVLAGAISLVDGTTITSICVDGVGDPLEIVLDGNSMGSNQEFVITNDIGTILALPGAGMTGPFDLDGAGEGICEIWHLAYEDGLEGLELNNNLDDLSGNFDLSNPVTVERQAANGGMLSLSDGSTTYTGTAGDIVIEVEHTTTATALSYWYIITDADDNILAYANSADTNTLDLSAAPPGECHVWGWSYRNEADPIVGEPITSLSDGACEAISDNFITVIRQSPVLAGAISLVDGTTITSICVDGVGDPLEIVLDGNSMGSNQEFVITNNVGTILALPGAGMTGPFDLDGAGEGICEIWYLAYEDGLEGLELNNNLDDLSGNFDLSNPVTVERQAANGGMLSLSDGSTTYTGTAGDIVIEVEHTTTATALSYWYIITDADDNILAYANSADTNTLDLSAAPPGECHVWGWSYRNEADPIVGEPITSLSDGACEAISDNFITVIRQEPSAVNRFGEEIGVQLFPNPVGAQLNVQIDGLDLSIARFDVYNLQGQLVSSQVTNQANGTNVIDTNTLPAGSYMLRIVSGEVVLSRRFLK